MPQTSPGLYWTRRIFTKMQHREGAWRAQGSSGFQVAALDLAHSFGSTLL